MGPEEAPEQVRVGGCVVWASRSSSSLWVLGSREDSLPYDTPWDTDMNLRPQPTSPTRASKSSRFNAPCQVLRPISGRVPPHGGGPGLQVASGAAFPSNSSVTSTPS